MNVTETTAMAAAVGVKNGRPAECGPSTVRRSASIAALAKAMAAAQGELKNPPKDSVNPHFKSKYADLATVRDAVVPVLARHKLAVMQFPCEMDDQPALLTLLAHESGEWIETTTKLRPVKLDPQSIGSSQTYAKRYALQAIAGVAADEDDDGNAGSKPGPQQQKQSPPPPPPPEPQPATPPQFILDYEKALNTAASLKAVHDTIAAIKADVDANRILPKGVAYLEQPKAKALARFPQKQTA